MGAYLYGKYARVECVIKGSTSGLCWQYIVAFNHLSESLQNLLLYL
jgi:hypothetical protein